MKREGIEYLQFRKLLKYSELIHCYTLSYNDFDVAGNDTFEGNKNRVCENYKKLTNTLNINYNHIIRPYQTHTNIVKSIENDVDKISIFPKEYWNVDGIITNKKDIVLSLGFADCTPLIFYDSVKKVIGNIHSGWKGTLTRIGQNAVKEMIHKYGCNTRDIICCIGPCIRKCHFEVEKDVREMFYNEFKDMKNLDEIIIPNTSSKGKYYIDTTKININMLQEVGILPENIIDSQICTVCNSNLMHSYRAMGKRAGRNTQIVTII